MPLKPLLLIGLVAVLIVGAAGVLVLDASRSDAIASGVRVGTIDIGGLQADAARERLQRRLLTPLDKPLVITAGGENYVLTAREAHIQTNIDATIDEAVERSREGGILARTWRAISGAEVNATVVPEIEYSRRAVQRLVDRVRVAVTRDPVDAKVDFHPESLSIRPSQVGRTIDALKLRATVEKALVSDLADRAITAEVNLVKPQVSGDRLAEKYPVVLTINRSGFKLNLFKDLKRIKTYPIAVGQVGLETPAGLYTIQNKAINPAWHVPNSDWAGDLAGKVIPGGAPDNPIKARWLGVYDGVGVHGTDARGSIGTNASHGCIRMLVEDVEELYDEVPIGTPIYIS